MESDESEVIACSYDKAREIGQKRIYLDTFCVRRDTER